jgi:hypothetical protein
MHHTALAQPLAHSVVPASRPSLAVVRDEIGASTAEYATVTGCGVGFAAVLFKFLTSSAGQQLISVIFRAIRALLPF